MCPHSFQGILSEISKELFVSLINKLHNYCMLKKSNTLQQKSQSNQIASSVYHLLLYLKIPSTYHHVALKMWKKMSNLLLKIHTMIMHDDMWLTQLIKTKQNLYLRDLTHVFMLNQNCTTGISCLFSLWSGLITPRTGQVVGRKKLRHVLDRLKNVMEQLQAFSLYFVCVYMWWCTCFPMCIGYLHTLGPNGGDSLSVCVYACMHFIIQLPPSHSNSLCQWSGHLCGVRCCFCRFYF